MLSPRLSRLLATAGAVSLATLTLAACGASSSPSASSGSASTGSDQAAASKTVKIALSNNFMGNEWRPQMVNAAKAVAASSKLGGKVSLETDISDPTPASQIASLQKIIRSKPDAIIIDAASTTALNPTIAQACAAGIKVVSFDQTVTADCAYKLTENYTDQATDMVTWMNAVLGGKGKVLVDNGLAGVELSTDFSAVFSKALGGTFPGLTSAGTYNSSFSDGPEAQGVSQLLTQNPDADGVLSNYSCATVISAYQKVGKLPKAVGCVASNRSAIACETNKVPCFFYGAPAWVGGLAVETAYKIVAKQGDQPKARDAFDTNYLSTAGKVDFTAKQKTEQLVAGKNYFPDQPAALVLPVTFGDYALTAAVVLAN